jgi:hypothetical protein
MGQVLTENAGERDDPGSKMKKKAVETQTTAFSGLAP